MKQTGGLPNIRFHQSFGCIIARSCLESRCKVNTQNSKNLIFRGSCKQIYSLGNIMYSFGIVLKHEKGSNFASGNKEINN